jgi:anti-anti-sigma factor
MAGLEPTRAEVGVSTSWEDAVAVVAVTGELDMSNVDALKSALAAVDAAKVVFDLRALRFMDSAGIAALLEARERIGSIALRAPSEPVRRVIEVTGLTDVLPIEP